jgi:hypothetical protein
MEKQIYKLTYEGWKMKEGKNNLKKKLEAKCKGHLKKEN